MKIIFLDIDGVVNNDYTGSYTSDGWCFVDDYLVERVALIVKATGAKIVLSSTWREGWVSNEYPDDNDISFNELKDKFAEYGMTFIDKTPDLRHGPRSYVHRGVEIAAWLEAHKHWNIESFVILDDWDDMDELSDHLVKTLNKNGISEENVKEAIKILNI